MTKKTLANAKREAKHFLGRVSALEDRLKKDSDLSAMYTDNLYGCVQSGAVKRASMDLTRALAEMRKSGF